MDKQQVIDLLIKYHTGTFISQEDTISLIKEWYDDKGLEVPDDDYFNQFALLLRYNVIDSVAQLFSALLDYYEQKHNIIKVLEKSPSGMLRVIHIY